MVVTKHDTLRKREELILSNEPDVIDILEWQNPVNGDNFHQVVAAASGEGYKLAMVSEKRYLYRVFNAGKFLGNFEAYTGSVKYRDAKGEARILLDSHAKIKLYVKFSRIN